MKLGAHFSVFCCSFFLVGVNFHYVLCSKIKKPSRSFQPGLCPKKCLITRESEECKLTKQNLQEHSNLEVFDICTENLTSRFNSTDECEVKCNGCGVKQMLSKCEIGRKVLNLRDKFDKCRMKPVTGPCKAHFRTWYYDVRAHECHTFIYGGCGGNGNRFNSQLKCLFNCGLLGFPKSRHNENHEIQVWK